MFELAQRARWRDILDLLESGSPPIYLQLLIANILFLLYFIIRGMVVKPQSKEKRATYRYNAELLVIATNAAILYEKGWLYLFQGSALSIYLQNLMRL
jgi:hypothetical protein